MPDYQPLPLSRVEYNKKNHPGHPGGHDGGHGHGDESHGPEHGGKG